MPTDPLVSLIKDVAEDVNAPLATLPRVTGGSVTTEESAERWDGSTFAGGDQVTVVETSYQIPPPAAAIASPAPDPGQPGGSVEFVSFRQVRGLKAPDPWTTTYRYPVKGQVHT
ncbi:hypothetical protein ASF49_08060 [Methylobacterium sp. Leaf104]|uniref:hypothetical protein n=1 Tax=Methylobacterium TaxID=407 RepID=UPI0007012146|nr:MULTISPECIES: hypothetical protein [Methylobacterium]KQP33811.1 hypothetical protein ASF49_08060 [Methylobacterium sp. Leaf104]MCI9879621.1 hypothetical protein [Methylobacterium goesingense]